MIVGYKLLDSEGAVLKSWGGTWGQAPAVPDFINLPNGDRVFCPVLGESYGGCTLTAWEMDHPPPSDPPDNYKPMIRRRADKLMRAGDIAGALLTLKQIGE